MGRPHGHRATTYLAEQGLVDRMDDPDDRRAALLVVTRAGRDVLRRARTRKDAWLSASLASTPSRWRPWRRRSTRSRP
ncbi:MAG: hypothetical protein R2690_00765 [Acidimicrobiales bacterium]